MKYAIISALGSHPWAETIQYHDSLESTNDLAKQLAEAEAPHGTVVIAGHQTRGRGRMGRTFQSPGNMGIYLSLILRPQCSAEKLMHLTCAVGVAMCNAVETATGYRPGMKWINDLVAENKKLGGILTELSLMPDGNVRYAVIGIGINCHQTAADFPKELENIACSLEMVTGKQTDRALLAASMISQLEALSHILLTEKGTIMDQYRRDCITLGREIAVIRDDRTVSAAAISLDDDGGLQIRYHDGTCESVTSGEVSVRGLCGYC